jgi:threonine dehydrogenase-like Zn-dependent dehydrogenase
MTVDVALIQVGLCAITSACTLFETVFATDLAPHRLEAAKRHGAIALPKEELSAAVLKATDGRGADACLEVVGHESALVTAMELARHYGVISSCGVHTHDTKLPGAMLYGKK